MIKTLLLACVGLAALSAQAATLASSAPSVSLQAAQQVLQTATLGGSTLSTARTELLSGNSLQSTLLPIAVTSAGTVTVTLTDLTWPTRLANLSFAATDSSHVLGRLAGPGVLSFAVAAAGVFSAEVFGTPAGPAAAGLYSLRVDFAPVPLPAAAFFLISGLLGLGGTARFSRKGAVRV